MTKRIIKTNLLGKEDIFKMLAVAEATKMPVLFLGVPGVGKTQALLDYAAAMFNYDKEEVRRSSYILETDEGTRTSEIKGRVNMAELLENKTYKIDAPIADAKYVLVNEIDKGSSGVRNTLLSVMRERALFYGDEIKKCAWQLFAASCNEIPEDEKKSPFWDRFIMKYPVERVGANNLEEMWNCVYGGKKCELEIDVPSAQDIKDCGFSNELMKKFCGMIYETVSDRTLAQLPKLCKAIKLAYACDDVNAIMLAATMICPERITEISSQLEHSDIVQIKSAMIDLNAIELEDDPDYAVELLQSITDQCDEITKSTEHSDETKQAIGEKVGKLLADPELGSLFAKFQMSNGVAADEAVREDLAVASNGQMEDDDNPF